MTTILTSLPFNRLAREWAAVTPAMPPPIMPILVLDESDLRGTRVADTVDENLAKRVVELPEKSRRNISWNKGEEEGRYCKS